MNFLCLKWGNLYGPEYVNNLYNMLQRNTSHPVKLYCMTEDPDRLYDDIKIIPILREDFKGWWHKITFFHPEITNYIEGDVLTFDLDIEIVDSIDPLIKYEGQFNIPRDRWPQNKYNSSVMKFKVGSMNHIYNNFTNIKGMWGDQVWISNQIEKIVSPYPDKWIRSYKYHCLNPKFFIPEECKVILFHGEPKPHDRMQDIGSYWV